MENVLLAMQMLITNRPHDRKQEGKKSFLSFFLYYSLQRTLEIQEEREREKVRKNKFVEAIVRQYSSRCDCFEKNQLILKPVVKEI